jgi:hypothetical protein
MLLDSQHTRIRPSPARATSVAAKVGGERRVEPAVRQVAVDHPFATTMRSLRLEREGQLHTGGREAEHLAAWADRNQRTVTLEQERVGVRKDAAVSKTRIAGRAGDSSARKEGRDPEEKTPHLNAGSASPAASPRAKDRCG